MNGKIGSELISSEIFLFGCNIGNELATAYLRRLFIDKTSSIATISGRLIFPSNVAGIGYAIGLEPTNFCLGTILWDSTKTCYVADTIFSLKAKLHYQLYRIGTLSSITNITAPYYIKSEEVYIPTGGDNSYTGGPSYRISSASITIPFNLTISTCSLQSSKTANINLPNIYNSNLPSINSVTGKTPFSLIINCQNNTKLYITFTDNNKIGQTTNILTPTATSTAKGVGVQLQYNGNIISFGPDSAEPGTINQIVLNNNLTGIQTFPFTASYVRTGTVTPGTLSAKTTFTLSYQ